MTRRLILPGCALAGVLIALGVVAARGRESGPVVGTVALDQVLGPLAVDPAGGQAFVLSLGAGDGASRVTIIDLRTGRGVRAIAVGSAPGGGTGALGIDAHKRHVVVATDGDVGTGTAARVTVLDARIGGRRRQAVIPPGPPGVTIDEATHRALVTSMGAATAGRGAGAAGSVSVLDTGSGRLLRVFPQAATTTLEAVDARAGRRIVAGRDARGTLGAVMIIDLRTVRTLGRVAPIPVPSLVAVDEATHRAFALAGGVVIVVDTRTGHPVRTVPVGAGAAALVVDTRTGRVFVACAPFSAGGRSPGAIHVLDAASGAMLRTLAMAGNPTTLALDARRDRVVATMVGPLDPRGAVTDTGSLAVLDARNGTLARTIRLGGIPGEVAIDEGTGRLVVGSGILPGADAADAWAGARVWAHRWLPWLSGLPLPAPPAPVRGRVSVLDLGVGG